MSAWLKNGEKIMTTLFTIDLKTIYFTSDIFFSTKNQQNCLMMTNDLSQKPIKKERIKLKWKKFQIISIILKRGSALRQVKILKRTENTFFCLGKSREKLWENREKVFLLFRKRCCCCFYRWWCLKNCRKRDVKSFMFPLSNRV